MAAASMGPALMVLLALASPWPAAEAMRVQLQASPVQKVLAALGGMKAKATVSLEVEKKTFSQYAEWVDDRAKDLVNEIEVGERTIEKLTATIGKAENRVNTLVREIAAFDKDINRIENEKKAAKSVRDKGRAEYLKLSKDYAESVDALERSIQVVETQQHDTPQALLQKLAQTSTGMRRVMDTYLQPPAVAAYKSQSGGVLQLLEQLLEKFKAELSTVEEEETTEAHNFKLEELHLNSLLEKATADREVKASLKAETAASAARAKGDLLDAKRELLADKATKKELQATFQTKSRVFKANQELRQQELEALEKALEILSTSDVSGSYQRNVAAVQEPGRQQAFLQLRSSKHRVDAQGQAVALLRRRATATGSSELATLANKALENPFSKVIFLIKDLLEKLQREAAAEASHKEWCDKQLKENKEKRVQRATAVERLTARIESISADIVKMGETIATLSSQQASLAKAITEATEQRQGDNEKNTQTIKDAQAGAAAVKQALEVLKEFYAQNGAVFLQGQTQQVPDMEAYTVQQGSSKGVVGLLEVILADFVRLESETKSGEDQAARDYEAFMKSTQAEKKAKYDREVNLKLEKDQAEFEQGQLKKDLKAADATLLKANTYYETLKPECVQVQVSTEERKARREEEIAALKEAYAILDSKGS